MTSQDVTSPDDLDTRRRRRPSVDTRSVLFRLLAVPVALLHLVLFEGLVAALEPALGSGSDPGRWETVQYGALTGVLLGGSLLACAWRPRRTVAALQVFLATSVVLMLAEMATQGFQLELLLIFAVTAGLPWLAHPTPGAALRVGRPSRAALLPAAATLVVGIVALALHPGIPSIAVAAALGATAALALGGGDGRRVAAGLLAIDLVVLGTGALLLHGGYAWPALGVLTLAVAGVWSWHARAAAAE